MSGKLTSAVVLRGTSAATAFEAVKNAQSPNGIRPAFRSARPASIFYSIEICYSTLYHEADDGSLSTKLRAWSLSLMAFILVFKIKNALAGTFFNVHTFLP